MSASCTIRISGFERKDFLAVIDAWNGCFIRYPRAHFATLDLYCDRSPAPSAPSVKVFAWTVRMASRCSSLGRALQLTTSCATR